MYMGNSKWSLCQKLDETYLVEILKQSSAEIILILLGRKALINSSSIKKMKSDMLLYLKNQTYQ